MGGESDCRKSGWDGPRGKKVRPTRMNRGQCQRYKQKSVSRKQCERGGEGEGSMGKNGERGPIKREEERWSWGNMRCSRAVEDRWPELKRAQAGRAADERGWETGCKNARVSTPEN